MPDEGLIKRCVENYARLMPYEYDFEFGHKAKPYSFTLIFPGDSFYHLAGMHKFAYYWSLMRKGGAYAFDQLVSDALDVSNIENSRFWTPDAISRLTAVAYLEEIVENGHLYVRYPRMQAPNSKISANYLLVATLPDIMNVHLFPKGEAVEDCKKEMRSRQVPVTIFDAKLGIDYTYGSMKLTLLKLIKRNVVTGNSSVVFERTK